MVWVRCGRVCDLRVREGCLSAVFVVNCVLTVVGTLLVGNLVPFKSCIRSELSSISSLPQNSSRHLRVWS